MPQGGATSRAARSASSPYVLAVDLGGTNLRAGAAGPDGEMAGEACEEAEGLTPERFVQRVRELAFALCPDEPAAVAIGVPAPVAVSGQVGHVVNIPALSGAPIAAMLRRTLGIPTVLENDVNMAALGEQRRGRARGKSDVTFIAIGTGVGMGIIAGGKILRGFCGGAGELGALPLAPDRVGSAPGELGPLEEVAGGAGLARRWAGHALGQADGHDVFAAAARGDPVATALLDAQADALAMGVRAVQALLAPELIVFGGGIGLRQDVFANIRRALARHDLPCPSIELSALGERAALLGAVEAALDLVNADGVAAGDGGHHGKLA